MKPRKVVGVEALLFEKCDRQRVTKREGYRSARGGREIVRTRLLLHPRIESHVAVPRQSRAGVAREGNCRYPEPLQMVEQRQQLH